MFNIMAEHVGVPVCAHSPHPLPGLAPARPYGVGPLWPQPWGRGVWAVVRLGSHPRPSCGPARTATSEGPGGPGRLPQRGHWVLIRAVLSPAACDVAVSKIRNEARGVTGVPSLPSAGEQSPDGLHKRLQDIPAAGPQVSLGGVRPQPQCRARPWPPGTRGARRSPVRGGSPCVLGVPDRPGALLVPREHWGAWSAGVGAAGGLQVGGVRGQCVQRPPALRCPHGGQRSRSSQSRPASGTSCPGTMHPSRSQARAQAADCEVRGSSTLDRDPFPPTEGTLSRAWPAWSPGSPARAVRGAVS